MIVHRFVDEQSRERRLIQIVPKSPLYLREWDNPGESKVCRAIAQVWRAIPPPDRVCIGDWVKSQDYFRRLKVDVFPAGEFSDRNAAAWFDPRLRLISFKSYLAVKLSKECLNALSAHELAHVLQAARGRNMTPSDELEVEADALAKAWGFDNFAFTKWVWRRIDTRVAWEHHRWEADLRRREELNSPKVMT